MSSVTEGSGTSRLYTSVAWLLLIVVAVMLLAGTHRKQPGPCQEPVTYCIGSVDPRFGLSRQEVADVANEAASIWRTAFNHELLREERDGTIEINLVYDYRQAAADKLKGLSGEMDNTKLSYDTLRARYENLNAEYKEKATALSSEVDSYNMRMIALKAESDAAIQKGGVPEDVYQRLMAEKEVLNSLHENLQMRQEELNNTADTLNSMVVVINAIATNLNLEAVNYNKVGEKLGNEFNEGLYVRKNGRQTITVYHFNSRDRLVRILAHELGHGLGLNHSNNPRALMYRLNQSNKLELAPEDIAALQKRCAGN
jgi:hypothetical protein